MESVPSSTTDEHRPDVTAKSEEEHEHEKQSSGSSEDSCESDISEGEKEAIPGWDEELIGEHFVRTSGDHGQQTNKPTRHGSDEGKKRHRRIKGGRHHRRFHQKPYSRMGKYGNRPQAPKNTTQFIIDDHLGNSSPQLEPFNVKEDGDGDGLTDFDKDSLREFHEELERYKRERMRNMTKAELIEKCILQTKSDD